MGSAGSNEDAEMHNFVAELLVASVAGTCGDGWISCL